MLILEPYLRIFKRIIATPVLVVATDRRLLIIREEPLTLKPRYGQRRFSLPVRRTAGLTLREAEDRLVLTYAPDPAILELVLDHEQRPAIAQLLDRRGATQHVYA
jgi:hypothetical protein